MAIDELKSLSNNRTKSNNRIELYDKNVNCVERDILNETDYLLVS